MEFFINIGKRLREVREMMGMSQSEFAAIAEKCGVPGTTRQSQAKYEKGLQTPSAAYLSAIATVGADVLYILTGEHSDTALTPDERQLLELFRAAPLTGKMAAVGALQGVLNPGAATVIATGNAKAAGRDLNYGAPKRTRRKSKETD